MPHWSEPIAWLLYGLFAVMLFTVLEGTVLLISGDPKKRVQATRERLKRHADRIGGADVLDARGILREDASSVSWTGMLTALLPKRQSLELLIYNAGAPFRLSQLVSLILLLATTGFAVGAIFLSSLFVAFGLALVGGALPLLVLLQKKRARLRLFEEQFPEALDLICRALRAGISLEFGFRSVSEELDDPIGGEFGQVADEISLGLETRVALQNLALRVDTPHMPFFTNAIMIQRETGGNLAEILDNLAHTLRDRVKFQGRVRALLAQSNLTANTLAGLPVVFCGLISVVSPGYIDPLLEPSRIYVLYGGAIMMVVGWLLCRKIASIDI